MSGSENKVTANSDARLSPAPYSRRLLARIDELEEALIRLADHHTTGTCHTFPDGESFDQLCCVPYDSLLIAKAGKVATL